MISIDKLLGLDKISKVLARVDGSTLRVHSEQCVRSRDVSRSCDKCVQMCPTGAISVSEGLVLESADCNDCGLCVSVCPTGVFEPKQSDEYLLSQVQMFLGKTPGASLYFNCSFAGASSPDSACAVHGCAMH